MGRGRFITLEGGEGAGKSTQVRFLVDFLAKKGIKAIATREVGGSIGAEDIRRLWLAKAHGFWDSLTEVLLIMAARREHLVKTILPALDSGVWVISDRYIDSTRAYQGIGQGLGTEKIDSLYSYIAGDLWPDRTILLDLPVDIGLARMKSRNGESDRFEEQNSSFHEVLRNAFLALAKNEPQRFVIVDASQDQINVQSSIERIALNLVEASSI